MKQLHDQEIVRLQAEIRAIVDETRIDERNIFGDMLRQMIRETVLESDTRSWLITEMKKIFSATAMERILGFSKIDTLFAYLEKKQFYMTSSGNAGHASLVIGLSFGELDTVNAKLATEINSTGTKKVMVQWEIARHMSSQSEIVSIDLLPGEAYMNTKTVIERMVLTESINAAGSVALVAQAWHAPRCVYWAEALGLQVEAIRTIDAFSPGDPQSWVRDPLGWVLKESIVASIEMKGVYDQ